MEFRPCIDIHNGKVKQIVGASLRDEEEAADENFVSEQDASYYAKFYQKQKIKGGHIILLNREGSPHYEDTKRQALLALKAYPMGLQVGGGITPENAAEFLQAGASHVVVTSYVFQDGRVDYDNLEKMRDAVGRDRLVLDLSCRKKSDGYYIVTDRWQKDTRIKLSEAVLDEFAGFCDEFLIHAVDVEGKTEGIEENLVELLGKWNGIPVTYAGGVHEFHDLEILKTLGKGKINVTVGSALDLFGGSMNWEEVLRYIRN